MATMEMRRSETIVKYFNRGRKIAWELQELGAVVNDEQLLTCLLAGLLDKIQLTQEVLLGRQGVTVLKAQELLQATETRTQRGGSRLHDDGNAFKTAADSKGVAKPKKDGKGIKCYNCNERGHISRECCKPKKGNGGAGGRSGHGSGRGGGRGDGGSSDGAADLAMMAVDVPVGDVNVPEYASLTAGQASTSGEWELDSGASHHRMGGEASLTHVKERDPIAIMLADGRVKFACRSGTAVLMVHGDDAPAKLTLSDVLVVPGLSAPLFSIRQAAGHGFKVEFDNHGVTIKDGDGKVRVRGVTMGKMHILQTLSRGGAALAATTPATTATATFWHRRFGHIGATTLERTQGVVTGMSLDKNELAMLRQTTCAPCIEGKMTRAPFASGAETAKECLEVIHSDTWGPIQTPSKSGNIFFTTVIDKHSRWKALVPHKVRGAAKDVLINVVNRWEAQTGKRAKIILTDGAKDYEGPRWDEWTKQKGIKHVTTARYTAEQNSLAERYNRTMAERIRAMLIEAKLDISW